MTIKTLHLKMGITNIFPNLAKYFPCCVSGQANSFPSKFHTLFIDGNQLYSDAAKEGGNTFQVFLKKIEDLFKSAKPIEWIYFSMDGSCPAAKFQSLRYKKLIEESTQPINNQENIFDTEFYTKITSRVDETDSLIKFFYDLRRRNIIPTNKFYFSSCLESGESEHKYLEFFRSLDPDTTINQQHVVYTSDNDLVFLLLLFNRYNFVIYRLPTKQTINISCLRNLIFSNKKNIFKDIEEGERQSVLNDIVALSFLMGNDFIPKFDDIPEEFCNFNNLINCYSSYLEHKNEHIIQNDSFNFQNLATFINLIRKNYVQDLSEIDGTTSKKLSKFHPEFQIACQQIKILFNFTWWYYSNKCPSWTFYYSFGGFPHLLAAIKNMDISIDNTIDEIKDVDTDLSNSVQELLFKDLVTQPANTFCLPKTISNIRLIENLKENWENVEFNLEEISQEYRDQKIKAVSATSNVTEEERNAINKLSQHGKCRILW